MVDFTVNLGGIELRDFEVPESIRAGGGQLVEIHRYAGGKRTIDSFGSDDEPIRWSGTFFDQDAESRCFQIDTMRVSGAPVSLTWSSFSYQVIIRSFGFEFQRFYQIAYSIELEVVQDNAQPQGDDDSDPESDMQGDLDDLGGFSSAIGDLDLSSALSTVTDLVGQAQSITGGSVPFLNELSGDVADAGDLVESLVDGFDAQADTFGGATLFASGVDPSAMTASLFSMADATDALPNAFCASNSLEKLNKSVVSILSGG